MQDLSAEWEFAAAGGDEQRLYAWGGEAPTASHANYYEGAASPYVDVGSTPLGNGRWGHADLVGSMMEWTLDWHRNDWYSDPAATGTDVANLTIPAVETRASRGADWDWPFFSPLRCAYRQPQLDHVHVRTHGVRCARAVSH